MEPRRARIERRRQRRARDQAEIVQARNMAKPPWQPAPKTSALRWRRGRGPGSYA